MNSVGDDPALSAMQRKLAALGVGFLDTLPRAVQDRVRALQDLQAQHDELLQQFKAERTALEAKYTRLYAPIFSRRGEIITGKAGSKTELMVRTKAAVRENDLVWCRPRFRGRFCTQAEENDLQTQLKFIPACGAGDKRDTIGVGAIVGQNETVLLAVRLSGGNHLKCQFSVCFLRWNSQRL
mmetsp:Transcript_7601/g.23127  ORF Transcript_7601/g.23127 Transcript_7601/m.23127 type:complete len:182 (-) Transcript_7601:1354-1899(-)